MSFVAFAGLKNVEHNATATQPQPKLVLIHESHILPNILALFSARSTLLHLKTLIFQLTYQQFFRLENLLTQLESLLSFSMYIAIRFQQSTFSR
jgi:hypothetical protein